MAKYVLVADSTLVAHYRHFPLLTFLPCAPSELVPNKVYYFLKGPQDKPMPNGEALTAPYSIRKLEAALIKAGVRREDIAVPHEDHLADFITNDTEIIAVSTMDPLGLGPLTMSYNVLFGVNHTPWVKVEWDRLMAKLNALRAGKKAKLIVGGPGVWEFTIEPEALKRYNIDYAVQGECDDVARQIFEQLSTGNIDTNLFSNGYTTYDMHFHKSYNEHSNFLSRKIGLAKGAPTLDELPTIVRPAMMGLAETMRGCGIGCDFCEVTLRPLRYYPPERIGEEVKVNLQSGITNAWLQTDEIFAYKHLNAKFEPNQEALVELFNHIMSIPGVKNANPTHGRISIPAAYPELISKLSAIARASPSNWIGVQVGVETGSNKLAQKHMPNKTLPLKVGVDGTWPEIVWKGTSNFNKYYWRPAFTVQVGQMVETPEDNWDTVALINWMSNSTIEGTTRPFEFTVTPMQNVPLGLIKNREFSAITLDEAQMSVYYASYRHLAKMAMRDARRDSKGNALVKNATAGIIYLGGWSMMKVVERIAKKHKIDIEKVKRWGLDREKNKQTMVMASKV
ncbi:MAG: B12-binding domain-containing radical SAM protein [Candidatus Marsarchaeota archaeon]|nr:B12-binding domain-containing radical SAM protein [Candidatus Marsarchaeota archaeon]MCL5114973.1 B12-binding domain-containing radical SAM protein [Candidatus Marsarchaeota archaeon]